MAAAATSTSSPALLPGFDHRPRIFIHSQDDDDDYSTNDSFYHSLTASPKQPAFHLIPLDINTPTARSQPRPALSHRPAHTRSLTVSTICSQDSDMSVETAPASPPELSSSKSSTKSSSLPSSGPPHDEELSDVSHFEDISLSDLHRSLPFKENRRAPKPRPLTRNSQTLSSPRFSQSATNLRDFSNELRTSVTLNNHVRSVREQRSPQHGKAPLPSPTLHIPPRPKGRVPSPIRLQPQNLSPSPKSPSSPRMTRVSTSPVLPQARRSSSSRRRKTAKEIEKDFHDSDDELPEDAVITNVPISPQPAASTRSLSNSPERAKTPKLGAQSPRTIQYPRTKSWDAAMLDLSAEVRELTTKLADHYDSSRRGSSDSNSSSGSDGRPTLAYRRARTWALPPIQRGSPLLDPLPPSTEKERHLTRTRPSWLPPKNPKEERKHMREYQRMITSFMESEKRRSAEAQQKSKSKDDTKTDSLKSWRLILSAWDNRIKDPSTRELWWRGVPAALRGQVWPRAIGNELQLTEASYRAALSRAKTIEARLAQSPRSGHHARQISLHESKSDARARRSLSAIATDIDTGAYPALSLFQSGQPRHDELRDLLLAYAAYREDTGHVRGTAGIAALLLLHHPILPPPSSSSPPPGSRPETTPGQPTLGLGHSESASAAAFIALANLLNRPLNLAFCLNDSAAKTRTYRHITKALDTKLPHLAAHFGVLGKEDGVGGEELFAPMCQGLFTGVLSVEEAARVWDVLVFEGDGVVVRGVVGVLGKLESGLYGRGEEAIRVLGWAKGGGVERGKEEEKGERRGSAAGVEGEGKKILDMCGEGTEEVVKWVRWAGRASTGGPKGAATTAMTPTTPVTPATPI